MNPHYPQVALRAGHRCEYCHAPEAVFNLSLEVEHIVPVARGGDDTDANWALACRACNLYKAAHVSGSDPESDAVVRLFHPREDQWESHFQVAPESGEIVGRTPIGRATVARLGINSAAQVAARQQRRPRTAAEQHAARVRFEQHFGEVDLPDARGADNKQIDADLAREYGDTHKGP